MITFTVVGQPAPQGSKKAIVVKGKAVLVESSKDRVRSWREDVRSAALDAVAASSWQQATGPVELHVTFTFQRPKSHYRTGRNSHLLRDDAMFFHAQTPDLDKILRSTCDALVSAGVLADDRLIASMVARKTWTEAPSSAVIRVERTA